jgi:hypothetical protein
VARLLGFEHQAASLISAPLGDYRFPFVRSATMATGIAGVIGTLIAFLSAYGLARVLVPALGASKKDAPSGN